MYLLLHPQRENIVSENIKNNDSELVSYFEGATHKHTKKYRK